MTETDDANWPAILRGYCTTVHGIEKADCGKVAMTAGELRAVAIKIDAQSTALTAAHEALDAQRERIAELEGALEFYADRRFDGYDVNITDYGISMDTGPIIKDAGDIARAALSAES